MSAKRVEALEAVQADLEYARSFYASWKPGGGEEILRKYFVLFTKKPALEVEIGEP